METSVSIKVRSGLSRSLSFVQSSLELCTSGDLFFFLWQKERKEEEKVQHIAYQVNRKS